MSLQNKLVVIVGGTSGIGFAVARAAMRENASVVVASSNQANVDAAVGRLSGSTRGLVVDVTSERSVESAFATLGPFDHLVFTAGDSLQLNELAAANLRKAREAFELRYWSALAAVNLPAGARLTHDKILEWRARCLARGPRRLVPKDDAQRTQSGERTCPRPHCPRTKPEPGTDGDRVGLARQTGYLGANWRSKRGATR